MMQGGVRKLGPYTLVRSVGRGASAEIFLAKAHDPSALHPSIYAIKDRSFAIKCLLPKLHSDEAMVSAFETEGRINLSLDHPNIAKVYEFNKRDGVYYLLMEYIQGKNLGEWLQYIEKFGGKLSIASALYITSQILSGLMYAHEKHDMDNKPMQIIHRDISPQNVLISFDGNVKLIDFGIANAAVKRDVTRAGIVKGKLSYMAPEQALGRPIDQRIDLYATALLLYQSLAGVNPLEAPNQYKTYQNVVLSNLPKIEEYAKVPVVLSQMLTRALQNDPNYRFQNAREFKERVDYILAIHAPGFGKEEFVQELNQLTGVAPSPVSRVRGSMVSKRRQVYVVQTLIPLLLGTLVALMFIVLTLLLFS